MDKTQYLPTLLIGINLMAAIVYFSSGDVRKGIYWLSASILTASVTF